MVDDGEGKEPDVRWPAFCDAEGQPDMILLGYGCAAGACFGISHVGAIHLRLVRWVPKLYSVAGATLPFGRAFFLLAFLQRGVTNQQRYVSND